MRMTKKVLSIVLSVLMVVSMMSVMAVATANAAEYTTKRISVFFTDSQNWDGSGVPQVWYQGKEYKGYNPSTYESIYEDMEEVWVPMTYLYDNTLGQSVYGARIPDDGSLRIKFSNNDKSVATNVVSSGIVSGAWWYADGNMDCQPIASTRQFSSLSADFVTNTGANEFIILDGRYYYYDSTDDTFYQYNNVSELYVAEVVGGAHDGEKYTLVNDAVQAAGEGGTVKLINDVVGQVAIDNKYTTTLDLNGHTITSDTYTINFYGAGYGQPVKPFTITDTSEGQTGEVICTSNSNYAACVADSSYSNIIIAGGKYTSANDKRALWISSDEGWEITGGTFDGDIFVKSDVEISGGSFDGEIINEGTPDYSTTYPWTMIPAEIEISGGTFTDDVSAYTTSSTYQNANGEVVAKAANTIYDDGDFAAAAAAGGNWYIVANVNGDDVTVTSDLKIWNSDNKDHTIAGDITVADGASIAKGGKKKVTFTGTTTLNGGSVSDANFTEIIVANDPYVHGQINNVPSGAVIKNGDGDRIVYDAISLAYAAKNGSEVYLVDDIADMYMTMNVNSGNFILHGDGHTVNFTFKGDYASALGKDASIAIDDLTVTVASGKALKTFIKANAADDNTGSVTIDDVSASGFSTADVYTGGGDWTFTSATITSATEPVCPEGWEAVDNNDGTWTITPHVHSYTLTPTFNWTQDAAGDWDCDTLTLYCACGDSQDTSVAGMLGASNVKVTANNDGSFTYKISKKISGVTYEDTKTNDANGVIVSVKQLKAAAKAGGSWELGTDLTDVTDVQCANGFVLDGNDYTVTRHGSVSVYPVFRITTNPAEVTLKNLTIDGIANQTDKKPAIGTKQSNPSAGNVFNLDNVSIINYDYDEVNNGVVLAWGEATVNIKDSDIATDSNYDVWAGAKAKVNINGSEVGTVYLNGGTATAALTNGADVDNIIAFAGNVITADSGDNITPPAGYKVQDNNDGTFSIVEKDLQDEAAEESNNSVGALEFVDGNGTSALDNTYRANLLGVQIRNEYAGGYLNENAENGNALRYVAAVENSFLDDLGEDSDYGFEVRVEGSDAVHTYSVKGTENTVINGSSDDFSFFTFAIYNITQTEKKIDVRFYVTRDKDLNTEETAYAIYKPDSDTSVYAINKSFSEIYDFIHSNG